MAKEDQPWDKVLESRLDKIDKQYTTDKWPATEETRRAYQQDIDNVQMDMDQLMKGHRQGELEQFDRNFKDRVSSRMDAEERKFWTSSTTPEDQVRIREARATEHTAIIRDEYRKTPQYEKEQREIIEFQDKRDAQILDRLHDHHDKMDTRFGFQRDREDRADLEDQNDRER